MQGDQKVHLGSSKPTILLQVNSLRVPPTSSFSLLFQGIGAKSMSDLENDGANEEMDLKPTKKRRLTSSQVQFLEKNFEEENKLEAERKLKLAGELGLQPRQVAIWFQNKRARFKNKQLEKDYDSLCADYEKLKLDYDKLAREKESLENEVASLKQKLLSKERGMETLELIDAQKYCHKSIPKAIYGKISGMPKVITPKQEQASSAKSDGFDSDSPMSLLEPGDSSQAFEPHQSGLSQDEINDASRRSLSSSLYFPGSCNLELPLEDQPFWSWTY